MNELIRTENLSVDASLQEFAMENQNIVKQLVLLQCDDFQRPVIKRLLKEAEAEVEEKTKPIFKSDRMHALSRSKSLNFKRGSNNEEMKSNLNKVKQITRSNQMKVEMAD